VSLDVTLVQPSSLCSDSFLNNAPTGPSANAGEPALELMRRLVLRLLPRNLDNFVKLPGSEIVCVDSHIHGE